MVTRRRGPLGTLGLSAVVATLLLAACQSQAAPLPGQSGTQAPSAPARPAATSGAQTSDPAVEVADCPPSGAATQLTGAGATFPAPLYTRWFAEYRNICGVEINYQAIGSGGGIRQHTERTVDFGASDGILTSQQFEAAPGTIMVPMTAGAEAIVVNLPGIARGQLKLSPETLAGIFLGEITKWNDPRIAADNQGMNLPDQDVIVVHRSDGSGTTFIFVDYLSKVSTAWRDRVGVGTSVDWPVGLGGEGNAGVAGQVRQLPGAVGYVELAYAVQNNMTWAAVKNAGGRFVEPSLEGATVAMEGVTLPDDMQVMITNTNRPDGYPIAGFTWMLVYEDQADSAKAQTLTHFLWWALHDGQSIGPELEYAPLSSEAVSKAEALVMQITAGGDPLLP
ncbi:MAG: phosphate ABC transporter substrate-binding protein PstS [Chloroflexi bacterium]|nr:phosphate ABC transporter substrate-binding protein PstS [Chloroflexota bacterium]